MPTINYTFVPNDLVWIITESCGIKHAIVLRFYTNVLSTGTTSQYEVRLEEDNSSLLVNTDKIFADSNLAGAMTAYQGTLT